MVIEPNNINKNSVQTTSNSGAQRSAGKAADSANEAIKASTASTDSVSLSSQAQEMARLETAVNTSPDVDQAKVDAIKQAIADGSYSVDPDSIAAKMLEQNDLF